MESLENENGEEDEQNNTETPQASSGEQNNESRDKSQNGTSLIPGSKKKIYKNKKNEKKVPSDDIESQLLKSVNDLIKGDCFNQDSATACFNMDDEDDLFCASIAKRMKKINPRAKGNLRVQIEHLTYQAEFPPAPQFNQSASFASNPTNFTSELNSSYFFNSSHSEIENGRSSYTTPIHPTINRPSLNLPQMAYQNPGTPTYTRQLMENQFSHSVGSPDSNTY